MLYCRTVVKWFSRKRLDHYSYPAAFAIIISVRHGATSNPWSRRTEGRRPWRRHPLCR
nr:MAG TPA: hypothetical protein [Caudoviricetes sp.]